MRTEVTYDYLVVRVVPRVERGEPAEASTRRQFADGPGLGPAGTDQRDGRQTSAHRVEVERRIERQQARLIHLDQRLEHVRVDA